LRGQWANKRDANEADIVIELRARGYSVTTMDKPVDLLLGKLGRTWIAEVKTTKGKLTKPQERFYKTWRGNTLILRSIQDVAEFDAYVREDKA
jgi:hypothetical protein